MTQAAKILRHSRASPAIARAIDDFVRRLARVTEIKHSLTVIVYPRATLTINGDAAFGAFEAGLQTIWVPGDMRKLKSILKTRSDCPAIEMAVETLCHEIAHYEQWRDGRKLQERGVAVRTRTLYRLARKL